MREIVADYGIEDHVERFSACYEGAGSVGELAPRIGDLKRLEREYRNFVHVYQDDLAGLRERVEGAG